MSIPPQVGPGRLQEAGVARAMVEQALLLYCQSYLAGIKAALLNQTITSLKESEQGLEREIFDRRITEERLRQAVEDAHRATELKDKFVALVAHDLRSPLSAVLGLMALMLEDRTEPLGAEKEELVRTAHQSITSLLEMIEKLLKISRLRSGKIAVEKSFVAVRFLASQIIQRLEMLAIGKGIRIINQIPEQTRFYVDRHLFGEVIQNLLSNAIKFSNPSGVVDLFVPHDQPFTLAVRDTGVGISPEMQRKVFRVEEKTSTLGTRGESGSGFGLPFSHDIMVAIGGELRVESTLGRGSTFLATTPPARPRVLLVEDEPIQRDLFYLYLEQLDVEVLEAGDGVEALQIIQRQAPHLVISDLLMPVMDGFQLLEYLRHDPRYQNLPVIVITSDEAMETRDRVFRLGADDYANKPLQIHEFLPRVRRLLE